jgi:hypothetical protein
MSVAGAGKSFRSPYLFPSDRPNGTNLAELSQPALSFLVANNIQILEPYMRVYVDTQGMGPLEEITVFHLFTWIHPSVILAPNNFVPCEGYQAVLDRMVASANLSIIFNSTVTQVVRNPDFVAVTNNGVTVNYGWIIFTNKPNNFGFADLRQDEIDLFAKLASKQVRLVAINSTNSSLYQSLQSIILPLNYDLSSTGTDWTQACRNDHFQRYPYDTPSNNFQCFQAFYNRNQSNNVTLTEMDTEIDNFLNALSALYNNSFVPYDVYSSFETYDYFFRFNQADFALGIFFQIIVKNKNKNE